MTKVTRNVEFEEAPGGRRKLGMRVSVREWIRPPVVVWRAMCSRVPASVARGAAVFALFLSGCTTTYEPFDSQKHLRELYLERLGPAGESLEVPYELDLEVKTAVQERLNPARSERQRTNDIIDFVFGWLDLEYALTPTRNAVQTFQTREGNCLSFVNLFVGIAREQRLSPVYVEVNDLQKWNYRDGVVVSQGHIVAGLYLDGQLSTYDFLPYRPKSYRNLNPIDDLTAAAHYYNNLAAEALLQDDVSRALDLVSVALALAPDFVKAVNNKGVALMRIGRGSEALALYEAALKREPMDVALLSNTARAYQLTGEAEKATEYLGRLEETNHSSPYFFVYRGERALGRGDTEEALEYMRKALKRDSEIPEVHIGLVRVYLATGEVDKARHHLQRALKLDATHSEARRLARMLSTGEVTQGASQP